jgi:hypothetical protein
MDKNKDGQQGKTTVDFWKQTANLELSEEEGREMEKDIYRLFGLLSDWDCLADGGMPNSDYGVNNE